MDRRSQLVAALLLMAWGAGWLPFALGGHVPPPAGGDWLVDDVSGYSDTTIVLDGNLVVQKNGNLTLDRVSLTLDAAKPGGFSVLVEAGGSLTVRNSTVRATTMANGFYMTVLGRLRLEDSVVENSSGSVRDTHPAINISSDDVVIARSTIQDCVGPGISIQNGAAPRILDSWVYRCDVGIFVADVVGPARGLAVIRGNHAVQTGSDGFIFGRGTFPTVVANQVENPGGAGFRLTASGATIETPTVTGATTAAGIEVTGGNATVRRAVITQSPTGVRFSAGTTGRLENSTIVSAAQAGVLIDASGPVVDNCTLTGGSWGVRVVNATGADEPRVQRTVIRGQSIGGIQVLSNSKPILDLNDISSVPWGILANQSSPTIRGNRILQVGIAAVEVQGQTFGTSVVGQNIIDTVPVGIRATDAVVLVEGNTVTNTAVTGLLIERTTGTVRGNRVTGALHGMEIRGPGMPALADDRISGTTIGLSVSDGSTVLTNESIDLNDFGITTLRTTADLVGGSVSGNRFGDLLLSDGSRLDVYGTFFGRNRVTVDETSMVRLVAAGTFLVRDASNRPVGGTTVHVTDRYGAFLLQRSTNPLGLTPLMVLPFERFNADGWNVSTPLVIGLLVEQVTNKSALTPGAGSLWPVYLDFPPGLNGTTGIQVVEDAQPLQELNLSAYLVDLDSPVGAIKVTSGSPNVRVKDDRVLQFDYRVLPTHANLEDHVNLTLDDGIRKVSLDFTVYVLSSNDPPRLVLPIADASIDEDADSWTLALSDHFQDEDDPALGYSFPGSVPANVTIDPVAQTLTWTPGAPDVALENVVVEANDFGNVVRSNPFTVRRITENDKPVFLKDHPAWRSSWNVKEHTNWTLNLSKFFTDEETPSTDLIYAVDEPLVSIDQATDLASWSPEHGSTRLQVNFTAIDPDNSDDKRWWIPSDPVTLHFEPVDDPPRFKGHIDDVIIEGNGTWRLVLRENFSDQEDGAVLDEYKLNKGESAGLFLAFSDRSHPDGQLEGFVILWTPAAVSLEATTIRNVTVTAFDSGGGSVVSNPFNLTYIPPDRPNPPPPTITEIIPIWLIVLVPVSILGTMVSVSAYRRYWAEKYAIREVFLVYNDGRLISHVAGEKAGKRIDEDVLASMLTAIQQFVRDSLAETGLDARTQAGMDDEDAADEEEEEERRGRTAGEEDDEPGTEESGSRDGERSDGAVRPKRIRKNRGTPMAGSAAAGGTSLDEVKYGNLTIVIERAPPVYLAAAIEGYASKVLRRRMQEVLKRVDDRYGPFLRKWDGDNRHLESIDELLLRLFV